MTTTAKPRARPNTFLITGEFVVEHARDRVFEFTWEDALRFLGTSLPEMTYEQMVSVLNGTKTFAGDSDTGLSLVDETPENRKELMTRYGRLYAGVFFDRPTTKYWRPYAYVTSWGPQDMAQRTASGRGNREQNRYIPYPYGSMVSERRGGGLKQWGRYRNVYYMDDSREDNVWYCEIPGVSGEASVLFKQVTAPPGWWKHLSDPRQAVNEYVAAGLVLDERGAHLERLREDEIKELMKEIKIPKGPPRSASLTVPVGPPVPDAPAGDSNFLAELMRERGVPDEVANGVARALTDTSEYVLPEPPKDPAKAKWAWVDREGRFWPCRGYMDHIPLAATLCRHFQINDSIRGGNSSKALEDCGWGKVGFSNLGTPYVSYVASMRKTKAFIEAATDWFMFHAKDDPDYADRLKRLVEDGDGFDY